MAYGPDELAGIVDLFGALAREELLAALSELSFRRGEPFDEAAVSAAIDDAVASFHLVPFGPTPLLAPGPAAFPTLPERADDLPHLIDVERRSPDRARVAAAAEGRLRRAVEAAVEADDHERLEELREVSYDLESWGPADVEAVRATIEDHW